MPTQNRPIRALVVDDNLDAADSFSRVLQSIGCKATFVTNPVVAIDAAVALDADVVFLDIAMPGLDGYELARMFRAQYGDRVRLVAVTAFGDLRHRAMSREAGFDAHVQKPADIDMVQSMLSTLFPGKQW